MTDPVVGVRGGCVIWLRYSWLRDIGRLNRLVSRWYRLHERNVPVKRFCMDSGQ